MIQLFVPKEGVVERATLVAGAPLPPGFVWVDLLEPTPQEQLGVERALGIDLPSREDMLEIEPSSRLYQEGGAYYMTATIITHADAPNPTSDAITFILAGGRLVTLRYADPKPVASFVHRALRHPGLCASGDDALLGLLETFVDRIADILEKVGGELDALSREIFREIAHDARRRARPDLRAVIRALGRDDDLASTARESLLSMSRLLRFLSQALEPNARKDHKARIKTMNLDLAWLSQHADFEAAKVNFLLDATLGMINIEQNNIIKIFSVAAVVFLPPTLVASIYGMNFRHLPELAWPLGYPLALGLMVVSAVVPYVFFKRKGWL